MKSELKLVTGTIVLVVLMIVLSECKNTTGFVAVEKQVVDTATFANELTLPADSLHKLYTSLRSRTGVFNYYQSRKGKPAWLMEGRKTALADSMVAIAKDIGHFGFRPENYHFEELREVENERGFDLLRKDVILTDVFLALARDLKFGRNNSIGREYDSVSFSLLDQVVSVGGLKKTLESQEPPYFEYKSLKAALRTLLNTNAIVDTVDFIRKVNVIGINMERWRFERKSFIGRYVFINIPSFMLYVLENGQITFSSKVIVGAIETPTPELSSIIECFTIYPYWNVPRKISVGEYLPIIQNDTTFLRRNHFDVLDRKGKVLKADSIDWTKVNKNYFPFVLRQREGPENSLGIIKFIFDNPYAVYLHDTNAKKLFKSSTRAFSHGCIRMERAIDLSHYLVTGDAGKKSRVVSDYVTVKQRNTIDLRQPIPIFVRYLTAEIRNQELTIYRDVYSHDRDQTWVTKKELPQLIKNRTVSHY